MGAAGTFIALAVLVTPAFVAPSQEVADRAFRPVAAKPAPAHRGPHALPGAAVEFGRAFGDEFLNGFACTVAWVHRNGIFDAMITTMDAAGRLVIPREVRREAGLEPGLPLDVRWRNGVVEIEPAPLPVTMERRGRLLVATPSTAVPALSTVAVDRTRRGLRTGRGRR